MKKKGTKIFPGASWYHWTVLNYEGEIPRKTKSGVKHKWLCRCICGTERVVSGTFSSLTSRQCSCKNPGRYAKGHKSLAENIDIYSQIRASYKREAKRRGFEWSITNDYFNDLVIQNCFYCNIEKSNKRWYNFWGQIEFNGIDRVDNTKGYTVENSVPCCKICNILKRAVTPSIIKKAYEFLKKNGTL